MSEEGFKRLRTAGQSLWMNHVTRELLQDGSLMRHIGAGTITGVSISPQSVCHSLSNSHIYDINFRRYLQEGLYGESLAYELLLEDVRFAADQLRHVFDQTDGVDGWAVLPVSPFLADNNKMTLLEMISTLYSKVRRPNTLITIPGHTSGLKVIEEAAFAGIPLNIAPIYTFDQFEDATDAYLCGIERRIAAGLSLNISAFISIAISELAAAYSEEMTREQTLSKAALAAKNFYEMMRELHSSQRWERTYNLGARHLRMVWLGCDENYSTGVEDMLFSQLVAPFTVAALSEQEMAKYHNNQNFSLLQDHKGNNESQSTGTGVDNAAKKLQEDEERKKINVWINLLELVAKKSADLAQTTTLFSAGDSR